MRKICHSDEMADTGRPESCQMTDSSAAGDENLAKTTPPPQSV